MKNILHILLIVVLTACSTSKKLNLAPEQQYILVDAKTRFYHDDGTRTYNDYKPFKTRTVENLEIYLLIGQSNMAGRAPVEQQDLDTLKNVFLFTGVEGNEWEKAANPLNKYSTVRKDISMQKLGPGYTFAREIAKAGAGKQIGLVVNDMPQKCLNCFRNKTTIT